MKSRLIASIVLLCLILIPGAVYWFFMVKKESSITIVPTRLDVPYSLKLEGTLNYAFLPLADKFFQFTQECRGICTISPIPPIQYTLLLTSTGYIEESRDIDLPTGVNQEIQYEIFGALNSDIVQIESSEPTDLPVGYTFLRKEKSGKYLVFHKTEFLSSIGLLSSDVFTSLRELSSTTTRVNMDPSKEFILIEHSLGTRILTSNFTDEIELPSEYGSPQFVSKLFGTWRVKTEKGVFYGNGQTWEENIRFTDAIDISPFVRIGYIAPEDTTKLSLGNLPSGVGVLIHLDRKTGQSYVMEKGITLDGFYEKDGQYYYIDKAGTRYKMQVQ